MERQFAGFVSALLFVAVVVQAEEPRAEPESAPAKSGGSREGLPQFDADDAMIVPKDYREWIFVGSSIGLGYKEAEEPKLGAFSHIYINPFGYRAFRETGKFPVGTVLMLEAVSRGQKKNPALTGYFSDKFTGLEAAVKTGDRFDDPWTYYNFFREGRQQPTGKRLTTKSCITCHRKHAETDHVFTQFYPVLRAAKPEQPERASE